MKSRMKKYIKARTAKLNFGNNFGFLKSRKVILKLSVKLAKKTTFFVLSQKYTIKTAFQCKFDGGVVQTQTMAGN